MRKNGWQTPFHPLQVVAVAVSFAMGIAFYVFLRPFTGYTAITNAALSLYTTMVVVVLVLYAWCVVVNPADPGVLCSSTSCNRSGSQPRETPTLYCTLCKVDILKNSRHCRSCDKCVDGFDHHCQWLNNCVGKKNYRVFFGLMVGTIFMLVLLWSLGLWVLIHGFMSKRESFDDMIAQKFGSSFPFAAYIGVVVSCTLLAMLATYPLCHLLIFHIVLCWKGISTYAFIVAMRDLEHIQASQGASDSDQSVVSSTKSSSGSCSSQGQGWCTPPRIVFDHEESVIQPEHFVSSNDVEDVPRRNEVDVVSRSNEEAEKVKVAVKLNPWKLASMNKDDLLRSSTKSISRSSVLRPASSRNETSSSSGSHKGSNETRIVGVKKSVSNDSCSAHIIEVRSRLCHDLSKESLGSEGLIKPSKAPSEALQPEGLLKPSTAKMDTLSLLPEKTRRALDATKELLIGRVFVLSSDGSGVSSESFRLRQGQLDMSVLRNSLAGWRWRQNPTFDAKGCKSVENSDEVASLPCTPTKRTPTFALHRLSSM